MAWGTIRRDALAIGLATGAYGVSYGVLGVAAGLSVAKTCAMSLLVFTGASQLAVVGVLGAGGGPAAALAPALLLAARNTVYGLSLVPSYEGDSRAVPPSRSWSSMSPRRWPARRASPGPHIVRFS